jgi:hypothetical protein
MSTLPDLTLLSIWKITSIMATHIFYDFIFSIKENEKLYE